MAEEQKVPSALFTSPPTNQCVIPLPTTTRRLNTLTTPFHLELLSEHPAYPPQYPYAQGVNPQPQSYSTHPSSAFEMQPLPPASNAVR